MQKYQLRKYNSIYIFEFICFIAEKQRKFCHFISETAAIFPGSVACKPNLF